MAAAFVTQAGAVETGPKHTSLQCQLEALLEAAAAHLSASPPHAPTMSASSGSQRPIKGILKNKGSSAASAASATSASSVMTPAQPSRGLTQLQARKTKKGDESNIRATCRAAYRDYDLQNINEPSTPHVRIQDGAEDLVREFEAKEQARGTAGHILGKLAATDATEPNCRLGELEGKEAHSSKLLLDKIERQRQFELRRKLHYTEGLNIKLGRELIAKELQYLEIDDEDEEKPPVATEEKAAAGEAEEDGPASEDLQAPASYL
ncbi:protein phosphatase inhibitor 2 family member C [Eptesicus fuscus]|uniref:protein phosphatase inhibitor 2 family member C n=1 Tax=Eptesicus fuscus TaxID=29078 RepID=UPI00046BA35B|nr:protein phosphatase inhibitor 2 family member C [Eptesicus fuscus]